MSQMSQKGFFRLRSCESDKLKVLHPQDDLKLVSPLQKSHNASLRSLARICLGLSISAYGIPPRVPPVISFADDQIPKLQAPRYASRSRGVLHKAPMHLSSVISHATAIKVKQCSPSTDSQQSSDGACASPHHSRAIHRTRQLCQSANRFTDYGGIIPIACQSAGIRASLRKTTETERPREYHRAVREHALPHRDTQASLGIPRTARSQCGLPGRP